MIEREAIATALRLIRLKRKMTQAALSQKTGIPRTHLYKIERGLHCCQLNTLFTYLEGVRISSWVFFRYAHRIDKKLKEDPHFFHKVLTSQPSRTKKRKLPDAKITFDGTHWTTSSSAAACPASDTAATDKGSSL